MKLITIGKSKRLIENRFYKDENLTSENIVKAFNLAGWQETRDWLSRDDDLTFIKGPSRISFNIVSNSGYNFTYYKDFEPKEYAADYIVYSGRNLKELEMDIEDFNNLEAKDFLKYKAPEFPWTKTTQETEISESKKLKEARMRNSGRKDQISVNFIAQETSIFFEDEGFSKIAHRAHPEPRTFRIFEDQGGLSIDVTINGDYEDDILINTFFDSRCGHGYVIQAQTLEGYVEWAGFDRSEFKEDLEEAYLSSKKFFETNKDKHTLETWLTREFGLDKARDTLEKLYQQGQEETFTKRLSREEFDAYKSSLNESEEYKYQILKSVEIKNLDKLKATVKETSESMGKDDAWVEWMTYASKLGRKYLGNKAGCDLGDDSHYYEAFENKLEISPYQTYSSQSIDRMIAARLACIKEG